MIKPAWLSAIPVLCWSWWSGRCILNQNKTKGLFRYPDIVTNVHTLILVSHFANTNLCFLMGGGGVLTYFWGGGVPSKPSNSDAILDGKSKLFFYPISDPSSETQGVGRTKASKSTRKRGGKGEEWGLGRKRERKEGGGGGDVPFLFPPPLPLPHALVFTCFCSPDALGFRGCFRPNCRNRYPISDQMKYA